MRISSSLVAAAIFFAHSASFAQGDNYAARLDSLMMQLQTHNKAMGTVLIAKNGKPIYHKEIGYEKIGAPKNTPATSETEYRIGSISKMFTATMILQLIEEKKLTLETTLATFYPQIPNAEKITIKQMLGHHSGLYDFTRDSDFVGWMTEPRTHDQMVAHIAKGTPRFAPGEKGEYSNTNFVLLGYIIEKITKRPYPEELEKRITKKIGLKHTYYGGKIGARPNEAASYAFENGKWEAGPESDMSIPGGAGAIVTTTSDLMQFVDALFKGKVISKSSLDRMTTIEDGYGLGMFKPPFGTRWSFGHNGRIDNFISDVTYFPDDSAEVVILTNGLDYSVNEIAIGVLSIYYNMPYSIPTFKTVAVAADSLPQYEGTYASDKIPIKFIVKVDGGELTAQATGQRAFPLSPSDTDEFQFEQAGIVIKFHRGPARNIDALSIVQHGSTMEFKRE